MGDRQTSDEIDYKTELVSVPEYVYTEISPTASSQITLTSTASQNVNFRGLGGSEITNPSLMQLSFLSTTTGVLDRGTFMILNNARLNSISARQGGIVLCDLNNALEYSNSVGPACLRLSEFLLMDVGRGAGTTANGVIEGYRPSNNTNSATGLTDSARRADNTSPRMNYTDFCYFQKQSGAAAGNKPSLQYKINLGVCFPHTWFSCNKDFPTGNRPLEFIFQFAATQNTNVRTFFTGTGGIDRTASTPTNSDVISNIKLIVAIENKRDIVDAINKKYTSPGGLEYTFDNIYSSSPSFTGVSQSPSLTLNAQAGGYLKAVYFAHYNNANTGTTLLEHSNLGAATAGMIESFRVLLNGRRIDSQYDISLTQANMDHWKIMKKRLKDSCLGQASDMFDYNFVWFSPFSEMSCIELADSNGSEEFGLPLKDLSYTYQVQATFVAATGTRRWFLWAVYTRRLRLSGTELPFYIY